MLISGNLTGRYMAQRSLNMKRAQFFAEELEIPAAFDAAVDFFIEKGVIEKTAFVKLSAQARREAFTIVADTRSYVLEQVKHYLENYLQDGGSVAEFSSEIFGYFIRMGVTPRHPYYYDTVINTNLAEAFNRGKDVIFEQADGDEFPFMQFHTVGDDRVRDSHAQLDGFIAPKDDPVWNRLKPPLSYNCRCTRSLVHKDEGLSPTPPKHYPDMSGDEFLFVKNNPKG